MVIQQIQHLLSLVSPDGYEEKNDSLIIELILQIFNKVFNGTITEEISAFLDEFITALNHVVDIPNLANALLSCHCNTVLFDVITRNDVNLLLRIEFLKLMNAALEKCSASTKEQLLKDIAFNEKLISFANQLTVVGDYEFQVGIIECLFRVIPKKKRHIYSKKFFLGESVCHGFEQIQDLHFETDARMFLNEFNSSYVTDERVKSIPCEKAYLGDKELKKPNDPGYEYFWVDFNCSSERITMFCEEYSTQLSQRSCAEDSWATLTINQADVMLYNVSRGENIHYVTIQLLEPISCIYPSQSDVSGEKIVLHFHCEYDIESVIIQIFGTEKRYVKKKVSTVTESLHLPARIQYEEDVQNEDEVTPEEESCSSQKVHNTNGSRVKVSVPCTPIRVFDSQSDYSEGISPSISTEYKLTSGQPQGFKSSASSTSSTKVSESVSSVSLRCNASIGIKSKKEELSVSTTPKSQGVGPKGKVKTPVVKVTPAINSKLKGSEKSRKSNKSKKSTASAKKEKRSINVNDFSEDEDSLQQQNVKKNTDKHKRFNEPTRNSFSNQRPKGQKEIQKRSRMLSTVKPIEEINKISSKRKSKQDDTTTKTFSELEDLCHTPVEENALPVESVPESQDIVVQENCEQQYYNEKELSQQENSMEQVMKRSIEKEMSSIGVCSKPTKSSHFKVPLAKSSDSTNRNSCATSQSNKSRLCSEDMKADNSKSERQAWKKQKSKSLKKPSRCSSVTENDDAHNVSSIDKFDTNSNGRKSNSTDQIDLADWHSRTTSPVSSAIEQQNSQNDIIRENSIKECDKIEKQEQRDSKRSRKKLSLQKSNMKSNPEQQSQRETRNKVKSIMKTHHVSYSEKSEEVKAPGVDKQSDGTVSKIGCLEGTVTDSDSTDTVTQVQPTNTLDKTQIEKSPRIHRESKKATGINKNVEELERTVTDSDSIDTITKVQDTNTLDKALIDKGSRRHRQYKRATSTNENVEELERTVTDSDSTDTITQVQPTKILDKTPIEKSSRRHRKSKKATGINKNIEELDRIVTDSESADTITQVQPTNTLDKTPIEKGYRRHRESKKATSTNKNVGELDRIVTDSDSTDTITQRSRRGKKAINTNTNVEENSSVNKEEQSKDKNILPGRNDLTNERMVRGDSKCEKRRGRSRLNDNESDRLYEENWNTVPGIREKVTQKKVSIDRNKKGKSHDKDTKTKKQIMKAQEEMPNDEFDTVSDVFDSDNDDIVIKSTFDENNYHQSTESDVTTLTNIGYTKENDFTKQRNGSKPVGWQRLTTSLRERVEGKMENNNKGKSSLLPKGSKISGAKLFSSRAVDEEPSKNSGTKLLSSQAVDQEHSKNSGNKLISSPAVDQEPSKNSCAKHLPQTIDEEQSVQEISLNQILEIEIQNDKNSTSKRTKQRPSKTSRSNKKSVLSEIVVSDGNEADDVYVIDDTEHRNLPKVTKESDRKSDSSQLGKDVYTYHSEDDSILAKTDHKTKKDNKKAKCSMRKDEGLVSEKDLHISDNNLQEQLTKSKELGVRSKASRKQNKHQTTHSKESCEKDVNIELRKAEQDDKGHCENNSVSEIDTDCSDHILKSINLDVGNKNSRRRERKQMANDDVSNKNREAVVLLERNDFVEQLQRKERDRLEVLHRKQKKIMPKDIELHDYLSESDECSENVDSVSEYQNFHEVAAERSQGIAMQENFMNDCSETLSGTRGSFFKTRFPDRHPELSQKSSKLLKKQTVTNYGHKTECAFQQSKSKCEMEYCDSKGKKQVQVYMSYSTLDRVEMPSEKGAADPYDFDNELDRLSTKSNENSSSMKYKKCNKINSVLKQNRKNKENILHNRKCIKDTRVYENSRTNVKRPQKPRQEKSVLSQKRKSAKNINLSLYDMDEICINDDDSACEGNKTKEQEIDHFSLSMYDVDKSKKNSNPKKSHGKSKKSNIDNELQYHYGNLFGNPSKFSIEQLPNDFGFMCSPEEGGLTMEDVPSKIPKLNTENWTSSKTLKNKGRKDTIKKHQQNQKVTKKRQQSKRAPVMYPETSPSEHSSSDMRESQQEDTLISARGNSVISHFNKICQKLTLLENEGFHRSQISLSDACGIDNPTPKKKAKRSCQDQNGKSLRQSYENVATTPVSQMHKEDSFQTPNLPSSSAVVEISSIKVPSIMSSSSVGGEENSMDSMDEEILLQGTERNKKREDLKGKKLKAVCSGFVSAYSSEVRPPRSAVKRKYQAISSCDEDSEISELWEPEDEEEMCTLKPRRLFNTNCKAPFNREDTDTVSQCTSSCNQDYREHGVMSIMQNFGMDFKKQIQTKRHSMEKLTKESMKSSYRQLNKAFQEMNDYRIKLCDDHLQNFADEANAITRDTTKLEDSETGAMALVKQQFKSLKEQRILQEKGLRKLKEIHQRFMKGATEAEAFATKKRESVTDVMKKDLLTLQKKVLLEAQQQELANVKRSLHNMMS